MNVFVSLTSADSQITAKRISPHDEVKTPDMPCTDICDVCKMAQFCAILQI